MKIEELQGRFKDWPERFWSRVDRRGDCWLWLGATSSGGYGSVTIDNRQFVASRIAYMLAHGEVPDDLVVCHSCDNPPCVNPAHLFLGTHRDNHADRESKGRGRRLSRDENPMTKLTTADVEAVRRLAAQGMSQEAIARQYGVAQYTVWRAIHGYPTRRKKAA